MSNGNQKPRVPDEVHRTKLTLAVRLVDAYTGTVPVTEYERSAIATREQRRSRRRGQNSMRYPRITLEGINADAVLNNSGFYLFLDEEIPGDTIVNVDGGNRYLDADPPVDQTVLDSLRPIEGTDLGRSPMYQEIRLQPSPAYRFPPGATLLRGHVRNSTGDGVEGTTLTIVGLDRVTETVRDGEFVIYFRDLTADDVRVEDGDTLVEVNGELPRIEVEHDTLGTDTVPLVAEEGATRSYILTYDEVENVLVDEFT